MSVLVVQELKKALGAQEVLRGVDLVVGAGEKVGCVGRNGSGKTTLLRLVEGEEQPDSGTVQIARKARIGYVAQRPLFAPGVTVRSYVETGLDEVHRIEAELRRVAEEMSAAKKDRLDGLMALHGELSARMEALGGWESERRVETVLSGIGLAQGLWDREARTLSGGEKSRTAMARELVSVPDLLLLDEPTNHLDVTGIEWLEDYLATIKSGILMVSHDRRMLDRVVDAIVEIENGVAVRYTGRYSRYVVLKAERYESALRAWKEEREMIRREEVFIRKHMGSQRTGEAKGRRKKLQNLERRERPYLDVRRPHIPPVRAEGGGEQVVALSGVSLGHGGKPLLSGVDLRVGRGERVGVVGPNGSGKTTLLKVLAGRMKPLGGEIVRGYRTECGFYDQETADLREEATVYEEIRRDHLELSDQEIRSHLALFLFRGGDVELEVRSLSGGERARLTLARLVLRGPTWLALDEPTNHLDLAGRTAVEEFLGAFPGAIVCVSHDREMLDRLCNVTVEVAEGRVRSFRGNYSAYREAIRPDPAGETAGQSGAGEGAGKRGGGAAPPKPRRRERKVRAGKEGGRSGSKPRNPWRFERLERDIISLEERRGALIEALGTEEVCRNREASREKQTELAEVERDLEEKNREWEHWT